MNQVNGLHCTKQMNLVAGELKLRMMNELLMNTTSLTRNELQNITKLQNMSELYKY